MCPKNSTPKSTAQLLTSLFWSLVKNKSGCIASARKTHLLFFGMEANCSMGSYLPKAVSFCFFHLVVLSLPRHPSLCFFKCILKLFIRSKCVQVWITFRTFLEGNVKIYTVFLKKTCMRTCRPASCLNFVYTAVCV